MFTALLESLQQNGHASTHSSSAGDSESPEENQSSADNHSAAEKKKSESAKAYTTEQADAVKR